MMMRDDDYFVDGVGTVLVVSFPALHMLFLEPLGWMRADLRAQRADWVFHTWV